MSFVTTIRDYVDTLNSVSDTLGQDLTLRSFIIETGLYIITTLKSGLIYFLSFQWIRDFTLLPIVLPQLSAAVFKETFFLETPSKVFFEFLEIPDLHQNKFLLGFFNSFFLSLPFSVIHIISVRRLLIQGIPSGIYSIGGYLAGQVLFLTCTLFGVRHILIPWLTFEPLSWVLGIILIFRIIYLMTGENLVELKGWTHPKYKNFFLVSFGLAWCEQTSVFQYLGNLTLSSNVTILESFSSNSPFSSFFTHFLYLSGIGIGLAFFTGLWGFFFLQVKKLCIFYTPLFTSSFIQWTNKISFVFALALSLTSIPFYGFDYLVSGPLGFVSQDSIFKNTLLDQTRVRDYAKGTTALSGLESNFKYIDLEISPFDRGEYLTALDVNEPLSFEDLNYRGEFAWITRNTKVSGISDSRSGIFTLSKLFKKQSTKSSDFQKELKHQEMFESNSLLSDTPQSSVIAEFESHSDIVKRYLEFYDGNTDQSNLESLQHPYPQISSASFPADFIREKSKFESQIEPKIKQKYYSNPVYKSLLALDIDLFLKRQPGKFKLNPDQEMDLYTKRKTLEAYSNSLKLYSQLPYAETFDNFFDGAKSFSNKVYNQQFKGTLRSVRRLFTVRTDASGDLKQNTKKQTVLKFDQPLYQDKHIFSPYHEELAQNAEDFGSNKDKLTVPIELVTKPLYAGWDEHLRKFVITNKLLPTTLAGYKVNIEPENRRKFDNQYSKQNQKIKFSVWPLSKEKLQQPKRSSSIGYTTLFEPLDEKAKQIFGETDYFTLPANLQKWEFRESLSEKGKEQKLKEPNLVPKRGGFVWPGNSNLKLQNLFQS